MKLANNSHLAYCTNIHRGSSWAETLESLDQYTLRVREWGVGGLLGGKGVTNEHRTQIVHDRPSQERKEEE